MSVLKQYLANNPAVRNTLEPPLASEAMRSSPWGDRRLSITFVISVIFLIASGNVLAQINLNVSHGATPNEVILMWSGGSPPYNLYIGDSGDLSGAGVTALLTNSSNTSYISTAAGNLLFFNVGDSTAPQVTISSPGPTVTAGRISVFGNTSTQASSVWVNRRPGQISGSAFTANDILLVLGNNTIHAAARSGNENIFIASSQVLRQPGNEPPNLAILSPANSSSVLDVTPLVEIIYSDTTALDPAMFRAYLDGSEQTSKFTVTPTGATWQIAGADALGIGTHVLRVTIQDAVGFTQGAAAQFRVFGPLLSVISPRKALPNDLVTINGEGFGPAQDTKTFFNGIQATDVIGVTSNQIQVRVPAAVTDGPVIVEVNGVPSNPLDFDVAFAAAGDAGLELAIDAQDRVYYVTSDRHSITRLNQGGGGGVSVFSTADEILGLSFDPAGTTLYVSTRGVPFYDGTSYRYYTGRIYSINSSGSASLRFVLDPNSFPRFSDPSGLDVKPPFVFVGAVQPDLSMSIIRLNLNNPSTRDVFYNFPLSDWLFSDVKVDSLGRIYSVYSPSGAYAPWIYQNAGYIYSLGSPTNLTVDCVDRVMFTDVNSGQVKRLISNNNAITLATPGGAPGGIDLDSKGNIFVATSAAVVRASGPFALVSSCASDFAGTLTGDSAKILADFDPVSGIEQPNTQYVVLTACLSDSSIPRSSSDKVYWTSQDVDDPATDPNLDPGGPLGDDNIGDMDGSAPFTEESPFTLTVGAPGPLQYGTIYGTVDSRICSKVRFHPKDAPGDNYVVTALLKTRVGDRSVASRTMTVWKRVHVELDSMGEVRGPVDDDDAVIGDVPDPTPDFLASIYAPAYLEIINDGPGPTTNVAFDGHVPDFFVSSDDPLYIQQIKDQGGLGREPSHISSSGMWWVYAQGTYEGPVNLDNDPITEVPLLGATLHGGRYSLLYAETVRDYLESLSVDESYYWRALLAHELAHQFGVEDDVVSVGGKGGIMERASNLTFPYFNATQLRIIREVAANNGFPSQ